MNCSYSSYTAAPSVTDLETTLIINSLLEDDKKQLINVSKRHFIDNSLDNADQQTAIVTKLLRVSCIFDSVSCATSLVNGDLGPVALVNEVEESSGMTALHLAAESHAARCVELLLKKRARTDIRSKDGRRLLPLELSLSSSRMDVIWNPDEYSVEDLVVILGQKNLTTVKLLSQKTKELDEVAYANAVGGRIVALAALLIVAADKVNESILVLHDSDLGAKEKTTIYECVIREALALGRATKLQRAVKRSSTPTTSQSAEKRELLLLEIELLQLFGAVANGSCTDKKVGQPLILATQAGDEDVIEILLKSKNIDINDADADGNSALHCALKTSMGLSQHVLQNRIVGILLKHGAIASQQNKLGLTALHIAAGSGNSQALEDLIRKEPDCINLKTIMMETPLFFAVKNDHMVCAEVLLRWGANSEVLNLRRERPIDFAKSQDMRFLLKAANTCHTNLAFLNQEKQNASLESDEDISGTCEALLSMVDDNSNTERICSGTKIEVCKYYESHSGCIRGSKCFYAHGEEQHRKMNPGMCMIHASTQEFKSKIFVGGLPFFLDSDSLGGYFEKHFGPIEDARVAEFQTEKQSVSRGFGFVTFKHEKSAAAAVQARFVTIMGKEVEIKSAVPKEVLFAELQKQSAQQQESKHEHQARLGAKIPDERTMEQIISRNAKEEIQTKKITEEMPCRRVTEEATAEKSWAGRLLYGQPKTSSNESQAYLVESLEEKSMPKWLRTFKKWLPRFLKDVYRHPLEGKYALSSLKTDFKAVCGLELDHASLGYSKLSDFLRTLPDLCHVKAGPIGKNGSPNHMVLVPSPPKQKWGALQLSKNGNPSSPVNSASGSNECDLNDSKSPQDLRSVSISSTIERKPTNEVPKGSSSQRDTSTSATSASKKVIDYSTIFSSSKPGLSSGKGNDGGSGGKNNEKGKGLENSKGKNPRPPEDHLVLRWLKGNNNSLFLREYDFSHEYNSCFKQKICFRCKKEEMQWANNPCQHLLWCNVCKRETIEAAAGSEHLCVICDKKVEDIMLISNPEEFPPLSPSDTL
ncbi:hypothetical protein WN944_005511 [Citrus x changshan-huyou]|uniref:Uncharacterized protein n=1 Tax=Citrus x changshan-huyou TaxID=2935761 RepID=A0AAP0QJY3_9ROSI